MFSSSSSEAISASSSESSRSLPIVSSLGSGFRLGGGDGGARELLRMGLLAVDEYSYTDSSMRGGGRTGWASTSLTSDIRRLWDPGSTLELDGQGFSGVEVSDPLVSERCWAWNLRSCSAASCWRAWILAWTPSSAPFTSPCAASSCNCCEARIAARAGLWNFVSGGKRRVSDGVGPVSEGSTAGGGDSSFCQANVATPDAASLCCHICVSLTLGWKYKPQ